MEEVPKTTVVPWLLMLMTIMFLDKVNNTIYNKSVGQELGSHLLQSP